MHTNHVIHAAMLAANAKHEHCEERFDDWGDGETGPRPSYCPAYDHYTLDETIHIVTDEGVVDSYTVDYIENMIGTVAGDAY